MAVKLLLICTIFITSLTAETNKINDNILIAILSAEKQKNRPIGYKFLISFNSKKEARIIKEQIPEAFLDNRTIDCKNKKLCIDLTQQLWKIGINNLDLGAFQINSKIHHLKIEDYFNFKTSANFADNYIKKMINKYGYNWYAIASYHSQTPNENYNYQKKLIKTYFSKKLLSLN